LSLFREECKELSAELLGRDSGRWEDEVDLLSNACYHGVTSLIGNQTLGEEYCDIMQTVTSRRREGKDLPIWRNLKIPSPQRRVHLMLLQVLVPYLYHTTRKSGRVMPQHPNDSAFRRCITATWNKFLSLCVNYDSLFSHLQRLHLAIFYFFGAYLQISKRLTGIRYIYLRQPDMGRPGYELLGLLLTIQLVVTTLQAFREWLRGRSGRSAEDTLQILPMPGEGRSLVAEESDEDDADGPKCSLCYSVRKNTTATECGHLFCWDCICRCITNKPECPLCRQPCALPKLICLGHYK